MECPGNAEGANYLNNFDNIELNVGYIRNCIINGAFEELAQYDTYRYVHVYVYMCVYDM